MFPEVGRGLHNDADTQSDGEGLYYRPIDRWKVLFQTQNERKTEKILFDLEGVFYNFFSDTLPISNAYRNPTQTHGRNKDLS